MGFFVGETNLNEGTHQLESPGLQLGSQGRRVRGHKAPITQLCPNVAGLLDFVEHLRVAESLSRQIEFEHAPRTWGVSNFNSRGMHFRVFLSKVFASVQLPFWFARRISPRSNHTPP